MEAYLCPSCGMQYAPGAAPPAKCVVCSEERQYIAVGGQKLTTL